MKDHVTRRFAGFLIAAVALLSCLPAVSAANLTNLRCEYLADPLGIDVEKPRLSWVIEDGGRKTEDRGQKQTAYQVLVASAPELLAKDRGDLWDSGKVASDQSIQVEYAGKPLLSRTRCYWKVRVWLARRSLGEGGDKDGKVSAWSPTSLWTMGLLKPEDWQGAKWIGLEAKPKPKQDEYFVFELPEGKTHTLDRVVLHNFGGSDNSYYSKEFTVQASETSAEDTAFKTVVAGTLKAETAPQTYKFDPVAARRVKLLVHSGYRADGQVELGEFEAYSPEGKNLVASKEGGKLVAFSSQWCESGDWSAARIHDGVVTGLSGAWCSKGTETLPVCPWLRKTFDLEAVPDCAFAYVNVMGYYELYVNGRKVGNDVLSPAASRYDKRSYYLTYDIKPYLQKGRNCVGLWLSRGWYWPGYPGVKHEWPIARAKLDIDAGGKHLSVGTDESWKGLPSNYSILGNWKWNEFGGEHLDARADIQGWSSSDIEDSGWQTAKTMEPPSGIVCAQVCPVNRITQTFPVVASTDLGNGLCELDFGRTICGWMKLRLPHLQAGQKVTLHYADWRYQTPNGDDTPAGHIGKGPSTRVFNAARGPVCYQVFNQVNEFVSAGTPGEVFCPKFNYQTFRYVIVEGLPAKPALQDAEALFIEGDLPVVGSFACSNPLLDRIYEVTFWSMRCETIGGYLGERTRERLGYGPEETMMEPALMTQNMPALFTKWIENWLDDQDPATGNFPFISPAWIPCGGGPSWAGSPAVIAWEMYHYYGDRRMVERCYEPILRFAEFLEQNSCRDGLLVRDPKPGQPHGPFNNDWSFLGDWVPPEHGMDAAKEAAPSWPPPRINEVFNNCYRVYFWQILERAAHALSKKEDARRFAERIAEMRKRIHEAYYDPAKHTYASEDQLYQAFPLLVGVVPDAERQAVLKTLEENILVRRNGHLDFGSSGAFYMTEFLQQIGRNDLMYTMVNQKDYPGWGYMIEQGATTFWEQWNGYWAKACACYLGHGHWFQQALAGIRGDETAPGFKKIIIKPAVVGDLTWVKGGYDSIHGRIVSNWRREGNKLNMDITVPANTIATVFVPAKDAAGVTESGKPAAQAEGVKLLRTESNAAVYAVDSGTYRFQSTLPETIE